MNPPKRRIAYTTATVAAAVAATASFASCYMSECSGRCENCRWNRLRRSVVATLAATNVQCIENFWTQKIDPERTCPRKLWRSVNALMGRGRVSASDLISVTEYHTFFGGKVADVRATTADDTPATYTSALPHCALSEFRPLDISDVINAVKLLPDKQCSADPMPTWLLKECAEVLAPFLCHMFNASLQQGYVPSMFTSAFIAPLLKSLIFTRQA